MRIKDTKIALTNGSFRLLTIVDFNLETQSLPLVYLREIHVLFEIK